MATRLWQPAPRNGTVFLNFSGTMLSQQVIGCVVEPMYVVSGFRDAVRDTRQLHKSELVIVASAEFLRSLTQKQVEAAARALRSLPLDCNVQFVSGPGATTPVPRSALPRRFLRFAPQNREAGLDH